MLKYVIWGAGHRGEIIYKILGDKYVSCFIDSNVDKQKKGFCGKQVISYADYKSRFSDNVVIVSPVLSSDISEKLDSDNVPYFFLDECPSEFMGYGIQTAKKYLNKLLDSVDNSSAFYGISIYSLWLYDILKEKRKADISFIKQENINPNILNKVLSVYKNLRLIDINQAKKENKKINVCFYDQTVNYTNISDDYFDIFDLSKNIIPYKNERIARLKDKYHGKRCFIVATGPSLRFEDLEKLRQNEEFCFSMNSVFYLFEKTKWRPDYYCILDGAAIDKWKHDLMGLSVDNSFIADSAISINYETLPSTFLIYHAISGRYWENNPIATNDFSIKAYNSCTVTNICIQLAMFMDFQEIYLLGVDFNYQPGKNNHISSNIDNSSELNMTTSFIADSNYYVLLGYKAMKAYADSHGIKIYNATRGGMLEVFERVDFDSLF